MSSHRFRPDHSDAYPFGDRFGFGIQIVNHFHVIGKKTNGCDHRVDRISRR